MSRENIADLMARWERELDSGRELSADELCVGRPAIVGVVRERISEIKMKRDMESRSIPNQADSSEKFESDETVPPTPGQFRRDIAIGAASPPGYEIVGELGRGGMGVVYRARQIALNRVVALKMILAGGHADYEARTRFLSEAEAIATVRHEGIVQVYDYGMHDGLPFFSLEFCEGGTLAQRLGGTPLPPREAAALVEQLARAMHAAHQAGIVHRDLKPANVLLSSVGHDSNVPHAMPKITDFGLAKRVEGGGQTQTGAIVGTPSYMAPEQASGSKDVGPLADVYALGAILYECLTGRPPFKASQPIETVLQVIGEEPVQLRHLNATVPLDLETICHKCLLKDPARRYGSADDLAEDLRRYQEGKPIAARPIGRVGRLVRWCRREPKVALLSALVLLVLLAGITVSSSFAMQEAKAAQDARDEKGRADTKTQEANENALKIEVKEKEAKRESAIARVEKAKAEREEAKAKAQKNQAVAQRNRAEELLYASQIQRAKLLWDDGYAEAAGNVLDECQRGRRGWEHRFLHTLFKHLGQRTFHGHLTNVDSVAYSPDGKLVVSGGDKTVRVWDADKGQELLSFKGHTSYVKSVAFSPNGRRVASASDDGMMKVWDLERGREVLSIKGHAKQITSLAFSPAGGQVITGSIDGTVKVWNVERGRLELTFKGHTSDVLGVAYCPNSNRVASVSKDNTVKVWDAQRGQVLLTLKGHTSDFRRVSYSPNGKRLVSGSGDGTVSVWDAESGRRIISFKGHTFDVTSVVYSPDGERLASSGHDGFIKVWDAERGRELLTLKGHAGWVMSLAFSPDGKRVVSGGQDGTIKVWDAELGQEVLKLFGHSNCVSSVAYNPDGRRIASGSCDGTVKVWDVDMNRELLTLQGCDGIMSMGVAYSPDGKLLVVSGDDSTIIVYNAETGRRIRTLKGHTGSVTSVTFSPDGKLIVSGSEDRTVKKWNTEGGLKPLTIQQHADSVSCVAYQPNGMRVASCSSDGIIKVWDITKGQEVLAIKTTGQEFFDIQGIGTVMSVAYSPDGKRIVSGGDGHDVKVWDSENGTLLLTLKGHAMNVTTVAYSPDSRRIVSGSYDGTVKVWDADRGQELLTLKGQAGVVMSVTFSPEGKRIVSGHLDQKVVIWDGERRSNLQSIRGHTNEVSSLAISPDGKFVVAGDVNGNRIAWDAETGEPVPVGDLVPPRGQLMDSRAGLSAHVGIDCIIVEHQSALPEPPPFIYDRITANKYHLLQANFYEFDKTWFAASFHLERLHRLAPHDRPVRQRLLAALARTPDSPASRQVRARLVAFDATQVAAFAAARQWLTPPPLAAPVPQLAPPEPTAPARMPYAQP